MDQPLSVALLFANMDTLKEFTALFRKIGILPAIFQSLPELLHHLDQTKPSLIIADIKLITEGEIFLKDHPLIAKEMIPLVFFYSKATEPLLVATYEYDHYGLIREDEPYEKGLKIILKRVNRVRSLLFQRDQLQLRLEELFQNKTPTPPQNEMKAKTSWELFSQLDHNPHYGVTTQLSFWSIDFTPLLAFIREKTTLSFLWDPFINDLLKKIKNSSPYSFEISYFGVHTLIFTLESKNSELFTQVLQKTIHNFTYARYFEETSLRFDSSCIPVINKMPPSTEGFLQILEGGKARA